MSVALNKTGTILIEGYDPAALRSMVRRFVERGSPVGFDTETTERNPRRDKLICLQFRQIGSERATVVDVRHLSEEQLREYGAILDPLFNGSVLILGQNLKFDYQFLFTRLGVRVRRLWDCMIAEQLIYGLGLSEAGEVGKGMSLEAIGGRRGQQVSKVERNWFVGLDQREEEWNAPLPEGQIEYGCQDVSVLGPIYAQQLDEIRRLGLVKVTHLEFRVLPAIAEMELAGIYINSEEWMKVIADQERLAREYENEALLVFAPHILAWRKEKFDAALKEYNRWCELRNGVEGTAKQLWEGSQRPSGTVLPGMELVRPEYVQFLPEPGEAWGKYKIRIMQAFREVQPNPGKPKPDTSLPNIGSHEQLMAAFERMGIKVTSTRSEYLAELEDQFPAVQVLQKFKKAKKLVEAFGTKLIEKIDPLTRRIHPDFVQIGASTGRNACNNPNWQQIPAQGVGALLRACVVPQDEDGCMVVADFSNIELRILAYYSRDETMLRFFKEGKDLHSETARMMFGLGPEVDPKTYCLPGTDVPVRRIAKTINFGLVYGMSPNKLARTLKISLEQAKELFEAYFRLYPGVKTWLEKMRRQGVSDMCSRTLSGRTRFYHLPDEPVRPRPVGGKMSSQAWAEYQEAIREWRGLRARIERQSTNTPIQGTSADITKFAVALFHERLIETGLYRSARLISVVHDELVCEAVRRVADDVKELLADCMDKAVKTFLGDVVFVPRPDAIVSTHWEH